jgi:hypothetical protein
MSISKPRIVAVFLLSLSSLWSADRPRHIVRGEEADPPRNFPYVDLEGTVEEFSFRRDWCHYYWREDFTMLVRDGAGNRHRIISREPTPWTDLRCGTTYPGLPVDWTAKPRVRVIGVRGIDRIPAEFYDMKLDGQTVTAFIVRVLTPGPNKEPAAWRDFYVNNWFHRWGADADRKVVAHYATNDPNFTIYGWLGDLAIPVDAAGKKLLARYEADYGGPMYHGRVVKANNDVGYEVQILHLMGRHKKTQNYDVFHGNPKELVKLDGTPPPEAKKK